MGARLAGLLALTAVGCGAPAPVTVDLSDAADGLGFVVVSEVQGVRVEGPFGLRGGALRFGDAPRTSLSPDGRGLVLVVPDAALARALPNYAPSRAAQVRLRVDAPLEATLRPDGALRETFPLPRETVAWRVDEAGAATVALDRTDLGPRLALEVDYDPEHCRPTAQAELRRWPRHDGLTFFMQNASSRRIRRVRHVGPDRVLAVPLQAAMLVRRGVALDDADAQGPLPRPVLRHTELWPGREGLNIVGADVDPRPTPDGGRRALLVVLSTDRSGLEPRFASRVLWATFDASGWTGTRTATETPHHRLRDVAFAADGSARVLGDGGRVFRLAPGEDTLTAGDIPRAEDDENRRVAPTGDPRRPWVMGGRNQVHDELADGSFTAVQFPSVGEDLHFDGLAAAPGEVWGGGDGGRLLLEDARGWAGAALALPPRLGPCNQQTGAARPVLSSDIDDVVMDADHVFVALDDCALVLHVRRRDRCTSTYLPEGSQADGSVSAVEAVSLGFGGLVAGGEDLGLYEVRLP